MVGREVGDIFPASQHEFGETALEIKNLTAYEAETGKRLVDDVSFSVRKGEVLGIAGLMGAGRSELLMSIFGAHLGRATGEILRRRKDAFRFPIRRSNQKRHRFVTEDRKRFGLILDQTILDNMTLAGLKQISGAFVTHRVRESVAAKKSMSNLHVKANSPLTVAGTLSGGNQQKVVLGKWLLTQPKVLFLDEPTRGIDVGAKQEIYANINRLAKQGLAIVMVSSELPEVIGLSDRILVLHEGKVTGEFARADVTPEKVMAAATGHHH
jgi:D-xylose transport system ATP-binding protein